jgi:hypothetical protein
MLKPQTAVLFVLALISSCAARFEVRGSLDPAQPMLPEPGSSFHFLADGDAALEPDLILKTEGWLQGRGYRIQPRASADYVGSIALGTRGYPGLWWHFVLKKVFSRAELAAGHARPLWTARAWIVEQSSERPLRFREDVRLMTGLALQHFMEDMTAPAQYSVRAARSVEGRPEETPPGGRPDPADPLARPAWSGKSKLSAKLMAKYVGAAPQVFIAILGEPDLSIGLPSDAFFFAEWSRAGTAPDKAADGAGEDHDGCAVSFLFHHGKLRDVALRVGDLPWSYSYSGGSACRRAVRPLLKADAGGGE